MRTESALERNGNNPVSEGQLNDVFTDEGVIFLDDELFPVDDRDELEDYPDVRDEWPASRSEILSSTAPAWRRIEQYKEQKRLHTQLEEIRWTT